MDPAPPVTMITWSFNWIAIAILVAVWLQWPLILLPAQLLWLNLVTNGRDAVDRIVKAAEDPSLTLDAIKALERTKSEKALTYLRGVAKDHYNFIIRNHAKSAIKKLE